MKYFVLIAVVIAFCECRPQSCDTVLFEAEAIKCHQEMVEEVADLLDNRESPQFAKAICRGLDRVHKCYGQVAEDTGCRVEKIDEVDEALQIGKGWIQKFTGIKC